jgi:hypothetical protein
MKRYFFDLRDGDELTRDDEGLELSTTEAVQEEAARPLADMARDASRRPTMERGTGWLSKSGTTPDRCYEPNSRSR